MGHYRDERRKNLIDLLFYCVFEWLEAAAERYDWGYLKRLEDKGAGGAEVTDSGYKANGQIQPPP